MAFSVVWDSTFRGTPAGSADIREGDDRIRELKTALQERLEREHYLDSATNANQGLHLEGSAVSYYAGGSDPTNRPDGVTALGDNDYDKGRLYLETTAIASVNSLKAWDGTAWEYAGLAQTTQDVYGSKAFQNGITVASGAIFESSLAISGDLSVGGTFSITDASVTQAKLKTSTQSGSNSSDQTVVVYHCTAGSSYCFAPLFGGNHITGTFGYITAHYYGKAGSFDTSDEHFIDVITNTDADLSNRVTVSVYSAQGSSYNRGTYLIRYVTSSGEIHWVFILRDKKTKEVLAVWEAPDHPSFGDPLSLLVHPFAGINRGNIKGKFTDLHNPLTAKTVLDQHDLEIIVVNPLKDQIQEIQDRARVDKKVRASILSMHYEIADIKTPLWPGKDGKAGYYPEPVTVGLADDEFPFGGTAEVVKKVIPKSDYVKVQKLVPRNLTQV